MLNLFSKCLKESFSKFIDSYNFLAKWQKFWSMWNNGEWFINLLVISQLLYNQNNIGSILRKFQNEDSPRVKVNEDEN